MKVIGFDRVSFAKEVREIVMQIPYGKVATYGDVAALAGSAAHSRYVGKILAMIGTDTTVPCHRVVNFQGRTAPHWPNQIALLKNEGIEFQSEGRVNLHIHRWHPE